MLWYHDFRRLSRFLKVVATLSSKLHHCYNYSIIYNIRGRGAMVVARIAAFHARVRGSFPNLGGLKETNLFLPHPLIKISIVGSLREREVACSNFDTLVQREVSTHSSHLSQEVMPAQFSLFVHKCGLKPQSFHFNSNLQRLWARDIEFLGDISIIHSSLRSTRSKSKLLTPHDG